MEHPQQAIRTRRGGCRDSAKIDSNRWSILTTLRRVAEALSICIASHHSWRFRGNGSGSVARMYERRDQPFGQEGSRSPLVRRSGSLAIGITSGEVLSGVVAVCCNGRRNPAHPSPSRLLAVSIESGLKHNMPTSNALGPGVEHQN